MKSRVTKLNYIQLPFRQFVSLYPEIALNMPQPVLEMFLSDPLYYVRFGKDNRLEIGYLDDEWEIN